MKSEFICELDGFEAGPFRTAETTRQWRLRHKALKVFEDDCRKLLDIFHSYWRVSTTLSDEAKAELLRSIFMDVYPDFLTNYDRQYHLNFLMDSLMDFGYKIIDPKNRPHINNTISICADKPIDLFAAWTTSDFKKWQDAVFV